MSQGVKALEDVGGSRGWRCYFVLFESWLWAQVCCDFNLEESHSVLGWLQLSRGCSAANLRKSSWKRPQPWHRNWGIKERGALIALDSRRAESRGFWIRCSGFLGRTEATSLYPPVFAAALPCLQGFAVELQAPLSVRFAAGTPRAELSQPTGPCGVLAATCSLSDKSEEHQLCCEW